MELQNKPPETALAQQSIKGWSFKYSNRSRGILYLVVGALFIVMGGLMVSASNSVIEHKERYDNLSRCEGRENPNCYVDIDVKDHMDSKVLFYYGIANMYQNHRAYGNSLSVSQLLGDDLSRSQIETACEPVLKVKNLERYPPVTHPDNNTVANPCGLVAMSYFNDEFVLNKIDDNGNLIEAVEIDDKGIAFYSDREYKFKNSKDTEDKRWTNVKDGKI